MSSFDDGFLRYHRVIDIGTVPDLSRKLANGIYTIVSSWDGCSSIEISAINSLVLKEKTKSLTLRT